MLSSKIQAQYFSQSRNLEKLSECFYRLENFTELAGLRSEVPEGMQICYSLRRFVLTWMIMYGVQVLHC
jgi:hypothetical protein